MKHIPESIQNSKLKSDVCNRVESLIQTLTIPPHQALDYLPAVLPSKYFPVPEESFPLTVTDTSVEITSLRDTHGINARSEAACQIASSPYLERDCVRQQKIGLKY
jgi:hypothetical protein